MMNDDIDLTNYIKIGEFRVNKDQVGCQFDNPFLLEMALQDFKEQLDAQFEHCRQSKDDVVLYIQTDVYRKTDAETLDDVWEDDLQFVFVQKVVLDEIIEIVDEDDGPEDGETYETELLEDSDYTRKCDDKYHQNYEPLGWIDIDISPNKHITYNLVNVKDESASEAIQQYFLKHYYKELSEESKRLGKRVFVVVDLRKGYDLKKDMKNAITLSKLIRLD